MKTQSNFWHLVGRFQGKLQSAERVALTIWFTCRQITLAPFLVTYAVLRTASALTRILLRGLIDVCFAIAGVACLTWLLFGLAHVLFYPAFH